MVPKFIAYPLCALMFIASISAGVMSHKDTDNKQASAAHVQSVSES